MRVGLLGVRPHDDLSVEDPARPAVEDPLVELAARAVRLRVIDGLPYPEVAARLQCAETAADELSALAEKRVLPVLDRVEPQAR